VTTPVRLAAAQVLLAVQHGSTTLAHETDRARRSVPDDRDRGLLVELTAGVLRWQTTLDALLEQCANRPVADLDDAVRVTLRLGAYQLEHLDRVPPHAVVHESVEVVRSLGRPHAAGFVNAVLRTFGRTRAALTLPARPQDDADRAASLAYLTTSLSHPEWLAARWLDRYGLDAAEAWCRFNNRPPELTIRPIRGVTIDELLTKLAGAGVDAANAPYVTDALRLAPGSLGRLPPDVAESFLVHDEGAQLVARAVSARPGDRVVDLCAAPGGKTVVLAADLEDVGRTFGAGTVAGPEGPASVRQGTLVACDVRDRRVKLLRATLRRGHAGAHIVQLDATRALPFGAVFDRVLLDAPCSGLGTVRRDPDLKWSRTPADFEPLRRTQRALIDRAAEVVAPGGSLVYATCSSEPEENDAIVDEFLATHAEFSLEPVLWHTGVTNGATLVDARGFLRTLPFVHGLDAYVAAVLVRRRTA